METSKLVRSFAQNERGSISITAAGVLLAAMMAVGIAVDYGRIASKQGDLQSAMDALETSDLALAVWDERYQPRTLELLEVNYEASALELSRDASGTETMAVVTDRVPTTILGLFGQPELVVTAQREIPARKPGTGASGSGTIRQSSGTIGQSKSSLEPKSKDSLSPEFKRRLQNNRTKGEQIEALNQALRRLKSMRSRLPEKQYRQAKRRIESLRSELRQGR